MGGRVATEREPPVECLPPICPPDFVGRERELAVLGQALASPPAVVLIEGEAGIGKSRLVHEFLATPSGSRQSALIARCPPFRQPCTLGPVVDAVRQVAEDVAGLRLSALAGVLRPLFPEWAAGLPPLPESLEDASAARHRLYRALAELLDSLTVAALVVEDAHWADEATLEFLLFLAARQPERPSLVVTYRPEDVPDGSLLRRLSSRLPAGTTCQRITLGPLDVAGTAGLVSSMLPGGHISDEFAKFLHAHTDGLPLAIEESVRLLRDRRDLRRRGGEWVRRHLDALAVPPTVRDAVLERASRLGPEAQTVLQAAAVLADPLTVPVLMSVSGLCGDEAGRGLAGALACGLLAEDAPNGRGLISFRHVLAARAVYEAIPVPERQGMHLRAGRVLEGWLPLPVARLARHFRAAGETSEWCRYAEQAADLALVTGDGLTAEALLHDLVTRGGLPARDVARLAGKIPFVTPDGSGLYQDLVRVFRAVLDGGRLEPDMEAELRCRLGRVLMLTYDYDAGRVELERAIPCLSHDPVEAAQAMLYLGWPLGTDWPASVHLEWLRRAAEVMAPLPAADRLNLEVLRVTGLLYLGEEEGWVAADQIPTDVPACRECLQVTRGNLNIGNQAMIWGRYDEARRRLAAALELAETRQYVRPRGAVLVTRLHLDWFTGAWDGLAGRADSLNGSRASGPA